MEIHKFITHIGKLLTAINRSRTRNLSFGHSRSLDLAREDQLHCQAQLRFANLPRLMTSAADVRLIPSLSLLHVKTPNFFSKQLPRLQHRGLKAQLLGCFGSTRVCNDRHPLTIWKGKAF